MKRWSAEEDTWLCESLETREECAGMKVPKRALPQPRRARAGSMKPTFPGKAGRWRSCGERVREVLGQPGSAWETKRAASGRSGRDGALSLMQGGEKEEERGRQEGEWGRGWPG